jgi:hypothetical protein
MQLEIKAATSIRFEIDMVRNDGQVEFSGFPTARTEWLEASLLQQ